MKRVQNKLKEQKESGRKIGSNGKRRKCKKCS